MRYSLPCVNEGAVLEWCNTCNGEMKHVRECDIYDKCTRGYVSDKVKSCEKCAREPNTPYKPDMTQQPNPIQRIGQMAPNSKRFMLRKVLEDRKKAQANRFIKVNTPDVKRSSVITDIIIHKQKPKEIKWAYGITTVPKRFDKELPKTIQSLAVAGFDSPRLFIDIQEAHRVCEVAIQYEEQFGLPITIRSPNIRAFGNWILALHELYIREPNADRYALFQDDIIACANLREYLDYLEYPDKGYLNLISYPQNEGLKNRIAIRAGLSTNELMGWYVSNQMGKGAQALTFSREMIHFIITNQQFLRRPESERGWQNIDGGLSEIMRKAGYKEFVHSPSLVRHTSEETSMDDGHPKTQPIDLSFPGESWDAMQIVKRLQELPT